MYNVSVHTQAKGLLSFPVGYGVGGTQPEAVPTEHGRQLLRQVSHSTLPICHQESSSGNI